MDNPYFPDDILVWPDGFWCFRKEFAENVMRGSDYRVIIEGSDEWVKISMPIVPTSLRDKPF